MEKWRMGSFQRSAFSNYARMSILGLGMFELRAITESGGLGLKSQ